MFERKLMSINANPVRGTKDYLPAEVALRDKVQGTILETYKKFGFQRINTPIMEDIERLNKSDGGENLSLIFKILKRGQKLDLTQEGLTENDLADSGLRYDLTMPLSRYYANNRQNLSLPFKCIQIDKVFRAERPQKGRLREFFQCDIDIIGDNSINAEMELIYVTATALLNIGFKGFTIRVNDRRLLNGIIEYAGFTHEDIPSVCMSFDKLDKVGIEGVYNELLEKGYAKDLVDTFIGIIRCYDGDLKSLNKYCNDQQVVDNLDNVISTIKSLSNDKFNIVYDKSLVRGMGYYTGMVFEIVSDQFSSSVAGGGRYDKMIGKFLGEEVPAVGFSIGFERICEILKDNDLVDVSGAPKLVLIYGEDNNFAEVMQKSEALRQEGYIVSLQKRGKKLGKQLDSLAEKGYSSVFMYGEAVEPKPLVKK